MAHLNRQAVIGVFEDRRMAQEAVIELKRAGFSEEQIGVASQDVDHRDVAERDEGSRMEEGAATGLAAGAGVGALWGLGITAGLLPAIGPAIAGGMLATILSSAAAGAAAVGLGGALIGLGIPEEEAEYYESEVKAGRTVVSVKVDGRVDEAREILARFGGFDMSRKTLDHGDVTSTSSEFRVPVREEQVNVEKQPTGEHKVPFTERTEDVRREGETRDPNR